MAARRHDRREDERDRRNARAGNNRTMNRCYISWECVCAGIGLGMFVLDSPAIAADMPASLPVKAPVAYVSKDYDWNGWYVGAHVGVIRGALNRSAAQPGGGRPGLGGT